MAARSGKGAKKKTRPLRELIEEAIVDCYTEDEQHEAFVVMLEDNLSCPFRARVVGEEVEVLGFEREGSFGEILAVCRRKGKKHRVNVTALEWIDAPPEGSEWLDAYTAWLTGEW